MTRFVRFSELSPASVNRDLHLHTCFTDGVPTVKEVIAQAEQLGLAEIAFTEHVRADSDWFPAFAREVREEAMESDVVVLVGAEARIADFDGALDISPEIRAACDIVLASVHRFPDGHGGLRAFADVPREEFADIERRLALGFLARGGADVLAHPGGMSLKTLKAFPDSHFREIMLAARDAGIAVEISSSYLRDPHGFFRLAREIDPLVSIGSDAHVLEELGHCRRLLLEQLWPA